MSIFSVRLSQLPALLVAALATLGAVVSSSRRVADVLSWLDPVEQAVDDPPALAIGGLRAVGALGGLGLTGCFPGNCGGGAAGATTINALDTRDARDARDADARAFDADLDAVELAADEGASDNMLAAQAERLDALPPPSAAKRALKEICESLGEERGYTQTVVQACACFEGYHPLELGDAHYPHHLNAVICSEGAHCRTSYYHVPLLTRRSLSGGQIAQAGQVSGGVVPTAPLVPEPLRKHWRFEYKSIPVACECVVPGSHRGQPGLGK